jgi:hypothetical protein
MGLGESYTCGIQCAKRESAGAAKEGDGKIYLAGTSWGAQTYTVRSGATSSRQDPAGTRV